MINKINYVNMPAWHFINDDFTLHFPHIQGGKLIKKVHPGLKLSVPPPLFMCTHGLHASLKVLDAFDFCSTNTICRVNLSGEILVDHDKLCASKREILWIADIREVIPKFLSWIKDEILKELKRLSKKKNPLDMKQFSFMKNMTLNKAIIDIKNINNRYFEIIRDLCYLNGYSIHHNGISYYLEKEFLSLRFLKVLMFSSRIISVEKINSKFEDLIYAAPRINK